MGRREGKWPLRSLVEGKEGEGSLLLGPEWPLPMGIALAAATGRQRRPGPSSSWGPPSLFRKTSVSSKDISFPYLDVVVCLELFTWFRAERGDFSGPLLKYEM